MTSAIAVALLAAPTLAVAQDKTADAAPRTHTVRKGDTLWDLAHQYLSDSFQWPEIYRLNKSVVEDPHWIYPGEVLTLPGGAPTVAEAPEPEPEVEAPRVPPRGGTVFGQMGGPAPSQPRTFSDQAIQAAPAVRRGEIIAAPWIDQQGGPGGGRVLESAELPRGDRGAMRSQLQLFDEILVQLPAGGSAKPGARYLAYELGEDVSPFSGYLGQMMYPTAVIEVLRTPAEGESAVARVQQLFLALTPGNRLIAIDSAALNAGARPTIALGDAGPVTTIRWVWRGQPLPSLQSYVMFEAGAREGVKVGDRYTIFRPRTKSVDSNEPDNPALDIATAQVVRVTERGSTAIVTSDKLPAIDVGMKARATLRVP